MKKIFLLCLLLISCSYIAFAQSNIQELRTRSYKPKSSKSNNKDYHQQQKQYVVKQRNEEEYKGRAIQINTDLIGTNKSNILEVEHSNDYVLYRDVVRRYTWLEGLGEPITQEIANHLPYYFRLSMKNDAGHYQMVEALHGNALTTVHPLSTYIIDKYSDTDEKNQEWRERLLTVGQWLFYSDLSGKNVVEERAYEAKSENAQLVYAMQVVQNDPTHITLTYLDSWGLPADMNEDNSYTYGSVVYVTYDKNGCDAIIDYLDGEGYRKSNTNGVDQERYVYDEQYRRIQITSNNCVGDYAIDNWGNCGVQYIYDDINNTYSIIHIDENLQPMRMPSIRANDESTYIRCDISKDKWGRISEEVFLTENGEKDTTLSGIHRIVYSYTDDGGLIDKKYYDINGNILK